MRQVWMTRKLVVLMTAVSVFGCSDVSRVTPGYVNPASGEFARAVMIKGPLLVRIAGSPYAAPAQAVEWRIEQSMAQALSWYANPRFSTDPAKAVGGSFYVSLIFNTGYVGAGQCGLQTPEGGAPQPQGAVEISAAFCDGTDLLATAAGSLPRSAGMDDPAFALLLGDITRALFSFPELLPWSRGIRIGVLRESALSG